MMGVRDKKRHVLSSSAVPVMSNLYFCASLGADHAATVGATPRRGPHRSRNPRPDPWPRESCRRTDLPTVNLPRANTVAQTLTRRQKRKKNLTLRHLRRCVPRPQLTADEPLLGATIRVCHTSEGLPPWLFLFSSFLSAHAIAPWQSLLGHSRQVTCFYVCVCVRFSNGFRQNHANMSHGKKKKTTAKNGVLAFSMYDAFINS